MPPLRLEGVTMDLWDGLFMILLVLLAFFMPTVSPCSGCMAQDNEYLFGENSCRQNCEAFLAYRKKREGK